MRRKYFGIAMAAIVTLVPASAWGGDREIAEQIIQRLNDSRDSGRLKGFNLDMKVDNGIVLFRGSVSNQSQRQVVLQAANGIEGVDQVIDQVSIAGQPSHTPPTGGTPAPSPAPVAATPVAAHVQSIAATAQADPAASGQATIGQALVEQAKNVQQAAADPSGTIQRTAAYEDQSDKQVVADVVAALREAKRRGQLRGFGVDVKSRHGVLQLTGRAGSADQRNQIVRIAERVPGVSGVREAISIPSDVESLPPLPRPPATAADEPSLTPLNPPVRTTPHVEGTRSMPVANAGGMPAMTAPYRVPSGAGRTPAMTAGMGTPVVGQPVPMAPVSAAGAPRYDSPNLPNYAWPGYAAYPNYAALTYPQQYSPTAWPYIGPFYPYPQVPLGWRKISLEWDDGWWFLDFTDR